MIKVNQELTKQIHDELRQALSNEFIGKSSNEENLYSLVKSATVFLDRLIGEGTVPVGTKFVAEIDPINPTNIKWNLVDKDGTPLEWRDTGDEGD